MGNFSSDRFAKSLLPAVLVIWLGLQGQLASAAQSEWARLGPDGKLTYKTFPAGDRIMDFSDAGYMGGGVKIPFVSVKKTVSPSGGDDTDAIQNAIDEVSKLKLQDGFRGAVMLEPGVFNCSKTMTIKSSGVVLRGSGSLENGTTIKMTGPPHLCFSIGEFGDVKPVGQPAAITDAYVPSGTYSFHVDKPENFHAGDHVLINRPATPVWVKFMGMDKMIRDGQKCEWVSGEMHNERTIKSISGNLITLDVPLADSFDSRYLNPPGGSMVKCDLSRRPTQIGIESLRIVSPPMVVTIDQPANHALQINSLTDGWVRHLKAVDTVNSFHINEQTSRLTIDSVDIRHTVATVGAPQPFDFWVGGTQTLVNRCSATGNSIWYVSPGARIMGPVVVLHCNFYGNGRLQPHMRWGTGLLVDNCQVPDGGIDLKNRGNAGTGHGWAIGWSVLWNCTAKNYIVQQPPGSVNWAIGCKGQPEVHAQPGDKNGPKLPSGIFDSHGIPVTPSSLYLAQLRERLGPQALENIGYPP